MLLWLILLVAFVLILSKTYSIEGYHSYYSYPSPWYRRRIRNHWIPSHYPSIRYGYRRGRYRGPRPAWYRRFMWW